ncbi:putative toxin-antitoxin system toxin component, PIN family [Candidatus Woesearchaeota archaeon]|nr:putative toxin-antitoxin system toxin component, PIN family [Candidatus Woesearchaeota archaeon]
MLKITADTNILISAAMTKGNEFELLRLAKLGKIELILSPQILKEFREVISRPKFGFSQEQIINVFKQIVNISTIVMPSVEVNIIKDDPEDNKVLECAETGKVDYIVSGDVHLLNLKQYKGVKIVQSKSILDII